MSEDEKPVDDEALADEWAAALAEQDDDEVDAPAQAQPVELENLQDTGVRGSSANSPNMDVILDIPVTLSMEVGSTDISIRNLLQLNQGSVIELDRLAGEPLDVLVNGTLIAHGEVVVVNEKFGIRLTDVISPAERIKKLG
ncbi:flagellar motor switch protein FliN [Ketobacter sp. MCCC 1A13808]|uniref:flagellar motor switch protein FliN n=1 Tax=Ketobacter sp. MCCC 1A13808 TaxID=2602738 RepID=UPI000F2BB477|nr:flagellar motor switch protein FliN [Ketobacter sp. MCCC 1A13808]MVF10908.1 flagellar motor switch protein FliN [Ketobacter sp. MCCC 1A13808]RLP56300.1 MAG: flagellar motor switch protein FliN [Ketobacter sp.]